MLFKDTKFFTQYFILGSKKSFYKITFLFSNNKHLFVNQHTDIVIEGYPRCGNTFAVAAFRYAQQKQGKNVRIARHRHEIAQILLGIKYKIPTLILIREPLEAISSFVVRENINPELAIKYYIYYYKHILDLKDNIVIADFRKVITNYGEIIRQINKKYGKNFAVFKHTPQAMEEVKRIIGKMELEDSGGAKVRITHLAFPTEERKKLKQEVKNVILSDRKLLEFLNEAQEIYQKVNGKQHRITP